jgi:hypothetical protein
MFTMASSASAIAAANAATAASWGVFAAQAGPVVSGAAANAGPAVAAGLVPYKTSGNGQQNTEVRGEISFAPAVVAERRVNRLKKSVWASGHLHGMVNNGFRPAQPWFVTLTYAKANAWAAKHVSEAFRGYRTWCKRKGVPCRYTWVAEIQPKRLESTGDAVVHYHMLAWLPVGVTMPHWDRSTTYRGKTVNCFWPHGMTNTEVAKSGVGYLMKYLSKLGEMSRFPKGLRLYGIGGLDAPARSVRRWYNLPEWVKRTCGVGDVSKVGNAFVMVATGEILEPAYAVIKGGFGLFLKPLRELPEKFHSGAYSSVSFA